MTIIFQIIIKIFQFFGMWPIYMKNCDNKTKITHHYNVILILWSLLNILALSVYIILICVHYELFLAKLKGVGEFSAMSKGGTVLITHLIILLESLYTRNGQEELWMKAKCVDQTFEKMGVATDIHNAKFNKNYSLKFFAYQLFAWFAEITVLFLVQDDLSWTLFNYGTIFSVMVSRSRHLHHALYIDMLRADFCTIKKQLEMLVDTTKSKEESNVLMKPTSTVHALDKIKLAKTAYSLLYEISVQLNSIVSLSQLVNLTQGFIYLTSDLHTLYVKLYLNDFAALLEICLSLLPTFAGLVLVMHSCEKCLGEVRLIGYLLHNIEKGDKQHQFDLIIENFSLQILHEPLSFSVAGFFNLDFMLLKAMVAAITTYMVIFIQFMPKDDSITN